MEGERITEKIPFCQYVSFNGAGLPCASRGTYFCARCHARVCGQHTRWRKIAGGPLDEPLCVDCHNATNGGMRP